MPFYEYKCRLCENEQVIFHSMSEDMTDQECESCNQPALERVISSLEKKVVNKNTSKTRIKDFIHVSKKALSEEKQALKGRTKDDH